MYLLLKNITTVLPKVSPQEFSWQFAHAKNNLEVFHGDILIDIVAGKIKKVASQISAPDHCQVLEQYQGHIVLPGFIDPHVHFRIPGTPNAENWHSGSAAALFAGITSVFDMPNTNPATIDNETFEQKKEAIEKDSFINYGIFAGVTSKNIETIFEQKQAIAFKVYMGSTTGNLLFENLQKLPNSALVCFHAEKESLIQENKKKFGALQSPLQHSQMRSPQTAYVATQEIVEHYQKHNANFHVCHISTPQEVELLNQTSLSWEAAPHHIFCSTQNYEDGGYLWKCNPPLREESLQQQMYQLLLQEKIPMIATDHAPHPLDKKIWQEQKPEPASGVPSVQVGSHFILQEVFKENISLAYASWILSSATALRFGVSKRGFIFEDYFADIAIIDPKKSWTFDSTQVLSACGWTPFENFSFLGKVEASMVNGQLYSCQELFHIKERKGKIYLL